MAKQFSFALGLLGCVAAAPVLIALVQRVFRLGLASELNDILVFYHDLFLPISTITWAPIEYVANLFGIHIELPRIFTELQMLSIILSGVIGRGLLQSDEYKFLESIGIIKKILFLSFYSLAMGVYGFSLLALTGIPLALGSMLGLQFFVEKDGEIGGMAPGLAKAGWGTVGAVGVFYVVNHLMLQ